MAKKSTFDVPPTVCQAQIAMVRIMKSRATDLLCEIIPAFERQGMDDTFRKLTEISLGEQRSNHDQLTQLAILIEEDPSLYRDPYKPTLIRRIDSALGEINHCINRLEGLL